MTTLPAKHELRARVAAARRARSDAARIVARAQIATHLFDALTRMARERPLRAQQLPFTVCTYLPLPSEPLPPRLVVDLIDAGIRVLAPVTVDAAPLDWCVIDRRSVPDVEALTTAGAFAAGPFGIAEPTGRRLGPAAIRGADVVLIPALAIDLTGTRLGRGGGHYDRSLSLLGPPDASANPVIPVRTPRLIAVLFDGEIVAELPHEAHDVRVTDVVTPDFGLCRVATPPAGVAKSRPRGASST